MTWFVDYKLDSTISVADRGLAYGDGVFETILATPKALVQLDDHLSRLYRGLSKLGMPFSLEQKIKLKDFLASRVRPLIHEKTVVKLIVSRGEGGRGYLAPEHCIHTVIIGILAAPDYQDHQNKGVSLSVSPVPAGCNRYLAGIKHLNRLENVVAKRFLSSADFEALMLNNQQELVECIQSNVFWFWRGTLYTPALHKAGVQGTFRKAIIEQQSRHLIQVGRYFISDLLKADEVFIANSLMGIVPVKSVAGRSFPIGSHTRKLQLLMHDKEMHGSH